MTTPSKIKKTVSWFFNWRSAVVAPVTAGINAEKSTLQYLLKTIKKPKYPKLSQEELRAWQAMTPHERWIDARARHQWDDEFLAFQRHYSVITAYVFLAFGIALLASAVFFVFHKPFAISGVVQPLIFACVFLLWYASAAWRVWQIDNQFIQPLKFWLKCPSAFLP